MIALFVLAVLAAGAMGFAIQRGGTCTVAAVEEVLSQRRAHRLAAMLEASLWVAGGLAIAQLLHVAGSMPGGVSIDGWTVAGGILLGLGAWINGACVFGAVARLGSGEWAYLLTPAGFYVGCLTAPFFARPAAAPSPASPLLSAAVCWRRSSSSYALWRVRPAFAQLRPRTGVQRLRERVWAPHAATIVIGATYVVTLLAAGRWAYTDVLADLAAGMANAVGIGVALLLALFAGALLGGWTAARWRSGVPSAAQLVRCFAGGVLMGWGGLLIPGSNDGLILIGIPLLYAYAWIAFGTMCLTIAAALMAQRAWLSRSENARDALTDASANDALRTTNAARHLHWGGAPCAPAPPSRKRR